MVDELLQSTVIQSKSLYNCNAGMLHFIFSKARVSLSQSVCTNVGEKIAISRRINRAWRLIGWGEIRKGTKIELNE